MEGSVSLKVLAGYLQSSCPLKCVFRVVSAFMESFCCRVSPRYFQTGAPRKVWLKSSHQGQINYLWGPELAIKQDWDLQLAFIFYYCVNCHGSSQACQQSSCLCVRPWPWEYRRAQIISDITISLQPSYFLFFRFPGSQKRRMYCVNIQRSCIENLSYLKFKKGEYLKCFIFTHCDNILNLLSFPLCRLTANWNDWSFWVASRIKVNKQGSQLAEVCFKTTEFEIDQSHFQFHSHLWLRREKWSSIEVILHQRDGTRKYLRFNPIRLGQMDTSTSMDIINWTGFRTRKSGVAMPWCDLMIENGHY